MKRAKYYGLLLIIAFIGLGLRFVDYDKVPPFDVTKDEFFYPWAGMSMLQGNAPRAWSLFNSYKDSEIVYKWGTWYRVVEPWVEKPPLFAVLSGSLVLATGVNDMFDVRLSTTRILPILLSFFSILLVGLNGKLFFGNATSLISASIYATVPTIVMSNRLSLTENLLTPLILLSILIFSIGVKSSYVEKIKSTVLGTLFALIILTKNIGIVLPLTLLTIMASEKKWNGFIIAGAITTISLLIHPLMGLSYGWGLFTSVLSEYRDVHALAGLPEVVQTIFRFPIVGHQWDKIFPDGSMLAGYILLFSAPIWLNTSNYFKSGKYQIFLLLGFPFLYLVFLALLESGATPYSYFGWHVYPVFPFLAILLGKIFYDLYKNPEILKTIFIYLIIGFSTVRFFLLIFPDIQLLWQWILTSILLLILLGVYLGRDSMRKILVIFFVIYLVINVLLVINLNEIYPGSPQPIS